VTAKRSNVVPHNGGRELGNGKRLGFSRGWRGTNRNANRERESKVTAFGNDLEGEEVEYDYIVGGVEVRSVPCDEYSGR